MPELKVQRSNGNLTWALSNLGLADLFKPGFAQLYDISDYKWLSVSDIIHKTYLDIEESGDQKVNPVPGAVPAPVMSSSPIRNMLHTQNPSKPSSNQYKKQAVPPPDHEIINVSIDKPFIYFVFDNVSGLVLVMGKFGREPVNYRLPV